jgi:hypothetical protein
VSVSRTTSVTVARGIRWSGQRVAIFYTKLHNRLLRPLLAAHDPPAPLRQALRVINHYIEDYIIEAV